MAQLDVHPTGSQEVAGLTCQVGNILSWRLIMKYFLLLADSRRAVVSFWQGCAQYWLTAERTKPAQEKCG